MAKIPTGILGETTGKIGPVIASTNRGINYIRSYVKPRYTRTAEQDVIRNKFQFLCKLGKINYKSIIKPFYANYLTTYQQSAWQEFFADNLSTADLMSAKQELKFSKGDLTVPTMTGCDRSLTANTLTISWFPFSGTMGNDNDKIYLYLLEHNEFILHRIDEDNLLRSDGTVTFDNWSSRDLGTGHVFIIAEADPFHVSITDGWVMHTEGTE